MLVRSKATIDVHLTEIMRGASLVHPEEQDSLMTLENRVNKNLFARAMSKKLREGQAE